MNAVPATALGEAGSWNRSSQPDSADGEGPVRSRSRRQRLFSDRRSARDNKSFSIARKIAEKPPSRSSSLSDSAFHQLRFQAPYNVLMTCSWGDLAIEPSFQPAGPLTGPYLFRFIALTGASRPLQAGARTNIRFRFHARVTRLRSPRTFSSPRSEN